MSSKSSDAGAVQSLMLLAMQDGRTSLYVASLKGHLPVVQFLVERGAKLEAANKVCFTSKHPINS